MNSRKLLVVLACCAAASPAMADITNGGFESNFINGNSDLPGWEAFDGRNILITHASTGPVHSGQYSARLRYEFGDEGVELNQHLTGLTPGQFYELSGMVYITEIDLRNWAIAGLQINVNVNKHDGVIYSSIQSSVTDGWQPFAVEFLAPSSGEAWINTMWYGADSGDAYVDSMALRSIPAPASASLLATTLMVTTRRRRGR